MITDAVGHALADIGQIKAATVAVAATAFAIVLFFKGRMAGVLKSSGVNPSLANAVAKAGPLVAVLVATVAVWLFGLSRPWAFWTASRLPSRGPGSGARRSIPISGCLRWAQQVSAPRSPAVAP